jgi:hypothetical protein
MSGGPGKNLFPQQKLPLPPSSRDGDEKVDKSPVGYLTGYVTYF